MELINKEKTLKMILEVQRMAVKDHLRLVNLEGACPDDKLIETGQIQLSKK